MRHHLTRTLVVALFALIALIAIALPTLLSANSDVEETPEVRTITLEPGDNFVGWVDRPLRLDELFAHIPEIELVYRWDNRAQHYEYALPGVSTAPEPLTTLGAQTTADIAVGGEQLTVGELFHAAPSVNLVYRWDATGQRWLSAIRNISPEHWTLDLLEPHTSATIRMGAGLGIDGRAVRRRATDCYGQPTQSRLGHLRLRVPRA